MKILMWTSFYLPSIGGLEIATHRLGRQLIKMGHEISVITNHPSGEIEKKYSIDGVEILSFGMMRALQKYDLKHIKEIIEKILHKIAEFKPEIIHIHGWHESYCFYQDRVLSTYKGPVVITIHGLLEQEHYRTLHCLRLWQRAKSVTTVSNAVIASLKKQAISHHSLKYIYNGLEISDDYKPLENKKNPHILMLGRLADEKGFEIAFYAIQKLAIQYPYLKASLVGGGPLFEELYQLRASLNLESYIELLDFVRPDRVFEYVDAADIVVIPSLYESFCLVALEAAMRARPVVANNVEGLAEVVSHGETGLLVPPGNVVLLAKAIEDLLLNFEKRKNYGLNARARAIKMFNMENIAAQYLSVYEEVAD